MLCFLICVEHCRKLESGAYGLQQEKMLVLYEKYKIDPAYLITGERREAFDWGLYLSTVAGKKGTALLADAFVHEKTDDRTSVISLSIFYRKRMYL